MKNSVIFRKPCFGNPVVSLHQLSWKHTPRFIADVRHLLPYMRTASRTATTRNHSRSRPIHSTNHQYFHIHLHHAKNCRKFGGTRSSSHFSDSDSGFHSVPRLHSTESRSELKPTQTISTSLEHEAPLARPASSSKPHTSSEPPLQSPPLPAACLPACLCDRTSAK